MFKELNIFIPSSFNDLLKLNTIEVEKLTGIIFLATLLKEDGVSFKINKTKNIPKTSLITHKKYI
jgi:hypothetical protein